MGKVLQVKGSKEKRTLHDYRATLRVLETFPTKKFRDEKDLLVLVTR